MITGDWIAGFADGEAWFSIMMCPSRTMKLGFNAAPLFRIQLHKSDIHALYLIRDFLGFGKVWVNKQGSGTYIVSSLKDAIKIKELFNKYPLNTKKRQTFNIWCKALDLIQAKRHLTKDGLMELASLRDSMNKNTRRQSRMDYKDFNYFKARLNKSDYQLGYFTK